jgi:hypothetical protein
LDDACFLDGSESTGVAVLGAEDAVSEFDASEVEVDDDGEADDVVVELAAADVDEVVCTTPIIVLVVGEP